MRAGVRRVLGTCCLLCPALSLGLDDGAALVQEAFLHSSRQPADLLKQAEEVLEAVGPLQVHQRPTVKDKENLMQAQALMKNPSLLKLYAKKKKPANKTAVDDKAASSSKASSTSSSASHHKKASSSSSSSKSTAHHKTVKHKASGSSSSSSRHSSSGKSSATHHHEAEAAHAEKKSVSTKHKTQSGSCSASDRAIMEELGGGSAKDSFPGITAKCGKKAFKFTGLDSSVFESCFSSESKGISKSCGNCFVGAASYGLKNCVAKCITSWCSKGCLDCSEDYRAGPLLKCVGFATPEATSC